MLAAAAAAAADNSPWHHPTTPCSDAPNALPTGICTAK